MNDLRRIALTAALAAAAAPLLAAPRRCANGLAPTLSGDAFSPIECSTAARSAAALPGAPVQAGEDADAWLASLAGRWEGSLVHALGRYELQLTVGTRRRGRLELALALKELQFHDRLSETLALTPADGPGVYSAELRADRAPGAALEGRVALGGSLDERQADLTFVNGAAHRLQVRLKGKNELRVRAASAVPGAPLQSFELVLRRAKRASP